MVKCNVLMCFNSSHMMPPGITFHRFPKDEMLRKAWVKNLNRENWQPSTASLLCSKHFEAHLLDRTGFRTILREFEVAITYQVKRKPQKEVLLAKVFCGSCRIPHFHQIQILQPHDTFDIYRGKVVEGAPDYVGAVTCTMFTGGQNTTLPRVKMAVEGVMVSYNYSKDGELANILTVSASGIRFSDRWVLTHGSILSPLNEAKAIQNARGKPILNDGFYENLPEIHVTCEKRSKTSTVYDSVERLSKDRDSGELEHSSYQIRVLTGRIVHVWQCPILDRCVDDILYSWTIGHRDGDVEKQTQLGKALLSVFVLIDLDSDKRGLKTLRPLSSLLDLVRPPTDRGSTVEVHSTPFGCEVFLNAVTRGSVCGVVGKRPSLLLTDAATALGSEGAPVFTEGPTKDLIGIVVCSVSWWRGEWVGLTLTAPLVSVLAAKLRVAQKPARTLTRHPHHDILDAIDRTTLLVRCGPAWGAGVYLGGGYVITCAHVVKHFTQSKVSLYCQGVKETAIVRYKTKDDKAYDLALLYTNPHHWGHLAPAVLADGLAEKGESVLAAGYPYFNETNLDDLRPTVTTGHINNVSPSLIQTSCCVQSGFSGGPIFRITKSHAVEVAAIIASNAKTETGACFPYINMAVPVMVFRQGIEAFIKDKDESQLSNIENKHEMIESQWRLLPYRSKI